MNDILKAALPATATAAAGLMIATVSLPLAAATWRGETEIVPIVVKTIRFTNIRLKVAESIEKESVGFQLAALPVDPAPSWPMALPRENNEPPATEAWASASPEERYLCDVYGRVPIKRDRSGDFTWKDQTAAQRRGMGVCEYAIGGLNPKFKKTLTQLGERLDEEGLNWSILSAFRDDFRQGIATGFKARTGFSRHGGSRATKGYGDGQAIDITVEPINELVRVFKIVDDFGRTLGLVRPMPRYDAAHIQTTSPIKHNIARLKNRKLQRRAAASKSTVNHEVGNRYTHAFAE